MHAAEPNDVLSIEVIREGETLEVQVTLGAREVRMLKPQKRIPPLHDRLLTHLWGFHDRLVTAKIVLDTDDGMKAFGAVVGKLKEEVEEGSKEFVLVPKDGGDEIDYKIDDETWVITRQKGDLGGLNTQDDTLVVDMNGQVKLVAQGKPFVDHRPSKRLFGPRFGTLDLDSDRRYDRSRSFLGLPELRKRLHDIEGMGELRERLRDILPSEIAERLEERLRQGDLELGVRPRIGLRDTLHELVCDEELREDLPERLRCFALMRMAIMPSSATRRA